MSGALHYDAMAAFRSQLFACLVVLGCLATLAVALPYPQEEDNGDFSQPQAPYTYNGPRQSSESEDTSNESNDNNSGEELSLAPAIAKRSADEPRIEPVRPGQTRPWSVPQLQDTHAQDTHAQKDKKEDKRSAEDTKETPRATVSTSATPTKNDYVTRPIPSLTANKKDKRESETREPSNPARLPSNTPTTPSKLNTPTIATRPAAPAARPEGASSDKKDIKRNAEDATTKLPETKPWQSRPEVTTEQSKTSARPVPLPLIHSGSNQ